MSHGLLTKVKSSSMEEGQRFGSTVLEQVDFHRQRRRRRRRGRGRGEEKVEDEEDEDHNLSLIPYTKLNSGHLGDSAGEAASS